MTNRQPYEIARETVKLLTTRKLVPSPENYQAVYHEVAGTQPLQAFPTEPLRQIVTGLPTQNPGQQKQKALLEFAIERSNWEGFQAAMLAYAGFGIPPVNGKVVAEDAPPVPVKAPAALTPEFMEQVARMVEFALPALGTDDDRFVEQATALLTFMRQPGSDVAAMKTMLADFSHRLSFAAEDQAEIKLALLRIVQLVIENIGELVLDDSWLKGQIDALVEVSTPPLSLRRLDDLEVRLKDVMFKQTEAKGRALEAQEQMKQMLARFIERLSQMVETSTEYDTKIGECARQIEQAKTIEEIAPVLQDAISATRSMALSSQTVRDELRSMREKTEAADQEIAKLHLELDRISTQARHDPLTGALNRKGLDEAVHREVTNAERKSTPLCIAVLDVDNFKKLNDNLGHEAGDKALTHLAKVTREALRPQDTLARYGGEEFVVLLPDTALDAGIAAMTRLQRELTTRLFMTGSERILITFSAGVAQLARNERGSEGIQRADKAMYLAKRAGKNRVLGA